MQGRIKTSSQFNEIYDYDVRGNRSSLQSNLLPQFQDQQYDYDALNRLEKVTVTEDFGAITRYNEVIYRYNGDDLLFEREENGKITRFYYDDMDVIAEANVVQGNPVLKAKYIRGNELVAQVNGTGEVYYYLHNEHGDVVELRDTAGEIVNQYDYDIWGTPIRKDETIYNPFLYSGEYWDEAVALQYLRARWYDPSLGRFITEDTYEGQLNNPLTLNLYVYTGNNPLIYIDPSGNVWEFVGNTWRYVKDGVVVATDFLFMDDIRTITNPDSSFLEKAVAGASLLPQGKILKAGKAGKLGDDVVDAGKSTSKAVNLP